MDIPTSYVQAILCPICILENALCASCANIGNPQKTYWASMVYYNYVLSSHGRESRIQWHTYTYILRCMHEYHLMPTRGPAAWATLHTLALVVMVVAVAVVAAVVAASLAQTASTPAPAGLGEWASRGGATLRPPHAQSSSGRWPWPAAPARGRVELAAPLPEAWLCFEPSKCKHPHMGQTTTCT